MLPNVTDLTVYLQIGFVSQSVDSIMFTNSGASIRRLHLKIMPISNFYIFFKAKYTDTHLCLCTKAVLMENQEGV